VRLGPVTDLREPWTEGRVDDVVGVPHEKRAVAHAREAGDLLDHLGVVIGRQNGLMSVCRHGHPADEVRDPDESGALQLGILVEEIVHVPRLVAHHEVERFDLQKIVDHHDVRDEDLVHLPPGLERVEVMLAGLGFEVSGLTGEEPAGRVDGLAAALEDPTR
jgi:hypothetical protein